MSKRWKPSVTVAAIVEQDGRYLLVEEHTANGLMLNNPAGHLERGESLLQAVVREAREETTRTFTPDALLGLYMSRSVRPDTGDEVTYLRIAFRGSVGEADPSLSLDHGIVRAVWMTPAEIEASRARHRSSSLWRCVQDHLAGVRLPLDIIHTDPDLFDEPVR
ncbi:MAG: nudJ [Rhizobacter sp.]|jgi:8-oxo-dGTP pyrophosphatase MutT (NUDIX family)|nr:nudJ [Rhizobacter sp.]